jgi:formylglycine-generating enzyme required for sulfatase activity
MPVTLPAKPFTHEIGIRFVLLRPGEVQVSPEHRIEFRRRILISAHEITNAQLERFDPKRVRHGKSSDDDQPAVNVRLKEALAFCRWLTKRDPMGRLYRLPDMGEWQYAARAGRDLRRFPWRRWWPWSDPISPSDAAYGGVGPKKVGSYAGNRFGLYDVIGNASEWAAVGDHPVELLLQMGATWEVVGSDGYVLMGGSWKSPAKALHLEQPETPPGPNDPLDHHGFRIVCEPAHIR